MCSQSEDLTYMLAYLETKQIMDFIDQLAVAEEAEDKTPKTKTPKGII